MNEKIIEVLTEVKVELAKNSQRLDSIDQNLAEHMRRTSTLENEVKSLQKWRYMVVGAVMLATFVIQILARKLN